MDFTEVVARRRMVRDYADKPVSPAALGRILEAAQRGPSAGFSQAVELVVIESLEGRARLAAAADEAGYVASGLSPWLSAAPVHVGVAVDPGRYAARYAEPDKAGRSTAVHEWSTPYWYVDAGAALLLLLLAATNEGLGAGFLGSHAFDDLGALLGFPSEFEAIGLVTIGHPAVRGPVGSATRPRRSPDEVIHHEQWRGQR